MGRISPHAMNAQATIVQVFLSSPSDVADERALAKQVLEELPYDPLIRGSISIRVVAWDHPGAPGLDARMTPQEALEAGLPSPAKCDIVVGIFWSRMGTPLDMLGKRYASGTAYELEEAKSGKGHVLVYRRGESVAFNPADPRFEERCDQWRAVEAFFEQFRDDTGAATGGFNSYETPSGFAKLLAGHVKSILARSFPSVGVQDRRVLRWQGSPFPGLRAFTTADAPIFFGRERETDELIRKVEQHRVCFVMGASGSGKSSIVGAGLLPRLKAGAVPGSADWLLPEYDEAAKRWHGVRFSPAERGSDVFLALAAQLAPLLSLQPGAVADRLRSEPWSLEEVAGPVLTSGRTVLIFVDQFEEIFTSVTPSDRIAFVKLLCQPTPNVRWVLTVRSDFYHRCVDIPELSRLMVIGQFPLSVPTDTLLDMITRPAERALLEFDEGLTWRILDETGQEPGSLALMAYALDELYALASRRADRRMRMTDYDAMGGVQGAIGKRAESTFSSLHGTASQREQSLWRVFRELVEVDERGVATRRRASLQSAAANEHDLALLDAFISARLLTTGMGDGEGLVEVAHEALLRSWRRLADWLESVQSDLRLLRLLKVATAEWVTNSRNPDYLWRGDRADEVQVMLRRLAPALSAEESEFARPETEHLLADLHLPATTHIRRETIGQRLVVLGDNRPGSGCDQGMPAIKWCQVHVGASDVQQFLDHEDKPFGMAVLHDFYIAAYPVTHVQFQSFLDAGGAADDRWWEGFEDGKRDLPTSTQAAANYPMDSVTWHFAVAFSRWLSEMTPKSILPPPLTSDGTWTIRLPHEWEWQWAAGGGAKVAPFPWGDWDSERCNLKEAGIGRTIAVGLYPHAAASCGALDMIGNVREWCLNVHKDVSDVSYGGTKPRALRGGSIFQDHLRAFTAYRASMGPSNPSREAGFRLVFAPTTNLRAA